MERWGAFIRKVRIRLGLKQEALAELLGVSQATVSRWEKGEQEASLAQRTKIRELLTRPLESNANDRAVFASVRYSRLLRYIIDEDLRFVEGSAPYIAEQPLGRRAFDILFHDARFRESRHMFLSVIPATIDPLQNPIGFLVFRYRSTILHPDGDLAFGHAIGEATPVKLSSGRAVWVITKQNVSEAEFNAMPENPRLIMLDEVDLDI